MPDSMQIDESGDIYLQSEIFFPLMKEVEKHLISSGSLENICIGWNCHLTHITCIAARVLLNAGARLILSECNPNTTSETACRLMEDAGAEILRGKNRHARLVKQAPRIISDTGFDLLGEYISCTGKKSESWKQLAGANEITTSGIDRLRAKKDKLSFPVININESTFKKKVENYHGVGEGISAAIKRLTGTSLQGKRAAIVGYGPVGRGIAHYLSSEKCIVSIVEQNPVRAVLAHYDGYGLEPLETAIERADILTTCTGRKGLIGSEHWKRCKDGILVINAGHWHEELDMSSLTSLAIEKEKLSTHLERFHLESPGRARYSVLVACDGNPANVSMLTGSIEPTLLHLATELLCMEYLHNEHSRLPAGEITVPENIESQLALMVLSTIDSSQAK